MKPNSHQIHRLDRTTNAAFECLADSRWFVLLAPVIMCLLVGLSTPFDDVLREDAYNYLKTAMAIKYGDWSVPETQPMGWSVFLAAILRILQVESIFGGMLVARLVSITAVAATIFPLAGIARVVAGGAGVVLVTLCFALNPILWFVGRSGSAESLFILLGMTSLYFFTTRPASIKNIIVTVTVAALAFHVRPQGLFLLGAILVTLALVWVKNKKPYHKHMLVAVGCFFIIVSPQLIARYVEFGSPFYFGENSKYFVDDISDVWAGNIPVPGLLQYLSTHTWPDYYEKFIEHGIFAVLKDFHFQLVLNFWIVLMYLGMAKILLVDRKDNLIALLAFLFIPLLSLTPVYDVFRSTRHLVSSIPIIYLVGAFGLRRSAGLQKLGVSGLITLIVLSATVYGRMPGISFTPQSTVSIPMVKDSWAVWAAMSLEGRVGIIEGGDLIDMSQHYMPIDPDIIQTGVHLNLVKRPYNTVNSRIEYVRPGKLSSFDEALAEFRRNSIRYLVLDNVHIRRLPQLRKAFSPKYSHDLKLLKHFEGGETLRDVYIYEIKQ